MTALMTPLRSLARRIIPRLKATIQARRKAWKYGWPLGPYRRTSAADRRQFAPVLEVWRPKGGIPLVYINWFITEWCNYDCPYCPQTHGRFEPKEGGRFTAHAFDNHPREKWMDAFARHFRDRRLSMKITGGESMIDKKNMVPLMAGLTELPTLESIRIDTNASWNPAPYSGIDKSKVVLMCTFHPSQVTFDVFWQRVLGMRDHGFRVGLVNYVMTHENLLHYREVRAEFERLAIPVQPNPLWDGAGYYSPEETELLRAELPADDFLYRTQSGPPRGKKCLHPAVAYDLNQNGDINVACHGIAGSFFDEKLPPLFAGPVPCPAGSCKCLDMYSFLGEINRNVTPDPLSVYSEMLLARPHLEANTQGVNT